MSFLHNVDPKEAVNLDAAILEDTAFLLIEQMKRKGYLSPSIEGRFQVGEVLRTVRWEGSYAIQLEVDFVADAAEFLITPGVLSYYDSVQVLGVGAIESETVERFFIPGGTLFAGKQAKVFTYENLERRNGRLLRALDDLGYRSARVIDRQVEEDPASGAVQVKLELEQGPPYQVDGAEVVITRMGEKKIRLDSHEGLILTRGWEQEQRAALRSEAYRAGYPDAKVTSEVVSDVKGPDGVIRRNLRYHVEYGQAVELAGVDFKGDEGTRRSTLRRQVKLKAGDPLDLIKVSEARRKLMGLGIYERVDLSFEPSAGDARSVVYELTPNQRKELQLRGGWGSYELARLGFKWEHRNPWGRAHRYEVEAKQSVKATLGDVTYSVPQVFGSDLTAYLNAEYSYREELSFDRTAQGVAFGTSTQLSESGVRLAVEYGFSKENADRDGLEAFDSEEDATVASVTFRASLDRRDDFLAPTSGYNLFASYKTAGQWLGGSVNFQKLEIGGTYHFSISESTIVHAGLRGGTIFSSGDAADNIPFNERYFQGGENSVRGYQEGGASPLDIDGDEIGAETYVLGNLELEQRLFTQFSVVLFLDAVANSRNGLFNEGDELLYSVGAGLRYNTIVGPLRLEYGHNPDPREDDPNGTVHFSIGYPF
ncbi:MAG: BamA/OMP85 family outer membrane protein [Opitutaceae bacterium]